MTVVLINGYAATRDDWDPTFLGALAGDFTIVRADIATASTVAGMAEDVVALLDERDVRSAPVVGWSLGGFIAQELAARFPERMHALVLLATDGGGPEAIRCSGEADRRLRDRSGTPREQASRLIGLLFPPQVAAGVDLFIVETFYSLEEVSLGIPFVKQAGIPAVESLYGALPGAN